VVGLLLGLTGGWFGSAGRSLMLRAHLLEWPREGR
jgi:hypothetical protein